MQKPDNTKCKLEQLYIVPNKHSRTEVIDNIHSVFYTRTFHIQHLFAEK